MNPLDTHSPRPPHQPQPPSWGCPGNLTALGPSRPWSHRVCVLAWLAYFPQRSLLEVHPRSSTCQLSLSPSKTLSYARPTQIHSFVHGHLGCFHPLAVVQRSQVSVCSPFMSISRSGVAGSNAIAMFNCLRRHRAAFHSGCTSSHSRRQCITIIPVSPHPCQSLLHAHSLTRSLCPLMGRKWL